MKEVGTATAALVPSGAWQGCDVIASAMAFMRRHLGMEGAYLLEISGANLVFRAVDGPGLEGRINVGDIFPLAHSYSEKILDGRLPELIPDTAQIPATQEIQATQLLSIRSHVSVPIMRDDGEVYGMFACMSREARPSLNSRDLDVMRAFASLSADQVNAQLTSELASHGKREAIEHILDNQSFEIALQPIVRLRDNTAAGYEALCRFTPEPYRPPNLWFDDAADVGLQQTLELTVIKAALALMPDIPETRHLAINTSPNTLASGSIYPLIESVDGHRIVIEITEHAVVEDLDVLLMEIDRLRELGALIAVDDAGAGYSGLQQIIRLSPDIIKLDMSLTKDVDQDLARRSLASAIVQFARDTNARVVAEGIETEAEMRTLRMLGVQLGQGYYLGRPALSSEVLRPRSEPKTA